jgi:hypothetical protein
VLAMVIHACGYKEMFCMMMMVMMLWRCEKVDVWDVIRDKMLRVLNGVVS